jgi:TolA-binding protein
MTWILRAAAVFAVAAFGYWFLQQNSTSTTNTPPPIVQTKPEIKPRVPTVRRPKSTPPRRDTPEAGTDPSSGIAQQDPDNSTPSPIEELNSPNTPDYVALANDYYRDRDFLPPKGSKGGSANSPAYNQALENFQDGKYNDAVSKIRPNLNIGTDALQQKELLAHSLYKSGQYEAAVPYFREVAASGKQPYAQRAEWGMALALLHQMPMKKPLFDRVLAGILNNPQHLFYSQAKRLEEQL